MPKGASLNLDMTNALRLRREQVQRGLLSRARGRSSPTSPGCCGGGSRERPPKPAEPLLLRVAKYRLRRPEASVGSTTGRVLSWALWELRRVASAWFGRHRAVPVSVPGFRRALGVLLARLRVLSDDRRRRPALLARYEARGGEPKLRIVVVTAEVGEGHAAAARAVAADLVGERADVEVLICDALAGLGRVLRYVLLDAYRWQLRSAPWIFGLLYRLFARVPLFRGLGRAGLALFGARGLLRLIDRYRPDIVVSTFPAATSVLGYLRRRGRLTVPTCATATDLAGLEFWAHRGIDLHLVMHESCVADRKSTRLNSSHVKISYAVFCLKKKKKE